MRILVFSGFFYPFKGGLTNSTMDSILGFLKEGHEVALVTCNTEKVAHEEIYRGVQIYRLPMWSFLSGTYPLPKWNRTTRAIFKKLKSEKWDIVWTQTRFFSTSLFGALFAKRHRIPLVHTERGAVHAELNNPVLNTLGKIYDHTIGWFIVRFADQAVGVSEETAKFLKHLGSKKPKAIFNGIDFQAFRKKGNSASLRGKYKLPPKAFLMVFVGRLVEAKGVQDVIEALPTLNESIHFIIVGSGNYRSQLKSLVKSKKLENRVTFLGEHKTEEVIEILSCADLFVNPSYAEGFPRCVLEASAVGMPIIASDVGGTKEIIGNSEYGLLVQPRDVRALAEAIQKMQLDEKFRERMAQDVLEFARERFSSERNVTSYLDVFRKLISSK